MTAKRFTIEKKGGMFYIFDDGNLIPVSDGQPICDLLNELAEENKGFKIDGEFKNKAYSKLLDGFMELKKKYQGIKKENKELKAENEQLRKENQTLIQGIQDTAKQGAETITKIWESKNQPKTIKRGYYD